MLADVQKAEGASIILQGTIVDKCSIKFKKIIFR